MCVYKFVQITSHPSISCDWISITSRVIFSTSFSTSDFTCFRIYRFQQLFVPAKFLKLTLVTTNSSQVITTWIKEWATSKLLSCRQFLVHLDEDVHTLSASSVRESAGLVDTTSKLRTGLAITKRSTIRHHRWVVQARTQALWMESYVQRRYEWRCLNSAKLKPCSHGWDNCWSITHLLLINLIVPK